MTDKVTAVIKNCNNIKKGEISWQPHSLNIKYGINGTGKSTIAKAIISQSDSSEAVHNIGYKLESLRPYGPLEHDDKPEINISNSVGKALVFNENYVSRFLFKENSNLIENAYEIFVKPQNYDVLKKQIDEMVDNIPKIYEELSINDLESNFNDFIKLAGNDKKITMSSSIAKAFKKGNHVDTVPEEFKDFSEYFDKEQNRVASWISWHGQGGSLMKENALNCPYCSGRIAEKRKLINDLDTKYDANSVKHLCNTLHNFDSLKPYFSVETLEILKDISSRTMEIRKEDIDVLNEIKDDVVAFRDKLVQIRGSLLPNRLVDIEKVPTALSSFKIYISNYPHLDSEITNGYVDKINGTLDVIIEKAVDLSKKVSALRKSVGMVISNNRDFINTFLRKAGYSYQVDVRNKNEPGDCSIVLIPDGSDNVVDNILEHLSYGEKNALALMLFLFDVVYENPELVIIDDPISSFDENKKYALMHMMFQTSYNNGERTFLPLKDKTVLMFTHDPDIMMDVIRTFKNEYAKYTPTASLIAIKNGVISEMDVTADDFKLFQNIVKDICEAPDVSLIVKLILLRRCIELYGDSNGNEYDVLSSLIHRKEIPDHKISETSFIRLSEDSIEDASNSIRRMIPEYKSYIDTYHIISDDKNIIADYRRTNCGYFRILLVRMLRNQYTPCDNAYVKTNEIFRNYINQGFHIDNEHFFQLDPRRYPLVPEYILDLCDHDISLIESKMMCDFS